MRKFIVVLIIIFSIIVPVRATEPDIPEVPEAGEQYMPEDTESFGEALWYIIKQAIGEFLPEISKSAGICLSVVGIMLLVSVLDYFSGISGKTVHLAAAISIGLILLNPAGSLIQLGMDTVIEMGEYHKLLVPVLTGALAAQGGISTSTALYAVTTFFTSFLTTLITKVVMPMLYIYLCLGLVQSALQNELLKNLQNFIKWLITWSLKIVLYVFTGFISITGVVSGTADASAVKAMKLTISGMIPVVGGIISDASETILVSAGVFKSAAGVYGILAVIAVFIGPFLKIGSQYLLLNVTGAVCSVFSAKQETDLLKDFSGGMGLLLASAGTVCLVMLIGTVCFMRGVA